MLKKYISHVKQRDPHERRLAAMRIAGSITGLIFIGWIATLGVRLSAPSPKTAAEVTGFQSQMASAISALSFQSDRIKSVLQVASTTPGPNEAGQTNNY